MFKLIRSDFQQQFLLTEKKTIFFLRNCCTLWIVEFFFNILNSPQSLTNSKYARNCYILLTKIILFICILNFFQNEFLIIHFHQIEQSFVSSLSIRIIYHVNLVAIYNETKVTRCIHRYQLFTDAVYTLIFFLLII